MKQNAQRILLSYYPSDPQTYAYWPIGVSRVACPEVTESGWRSLVYSLGKQGYLEFDGLPSRRVVALTNPGELALRGLFPALKSVQQLEAWNCVFCLDAPRQDPGFRYLRALMLKIGGIPLQRGSYLIPGAVPDQVLNECAVLYPQSVVIGRVEQWLFGDQRQLLKKHTLLRDVNDVYSGVSSELSRLLVKNYAEIQLIQQEKKQLSSLFNRLVDGLAKDPGLVTSLYPSAPQPLRLLTQWQSLVAESCC